MPATIVDSAIFGNLFSTEAMRQVWSDENRTRKYLDIEAALASFSQLHVDAFMVGADGYFITRRDQLAALAARYAIPGIYPFPDFPEAGGLLSYGVSLADAYRQAGLLTGRILKGAKPAELPVMQPTKFEFVLNLKTAKALGLDVPPILLARADEVIE